ncbi:hypothetical protein HNR44_001712 [Geomicrobium halophilum]|uniref:Uncharacterized protein n=1 Tax=Geomicrobium halophilum TaxID=549000 RepID=A0A841PPJ7_9BACL|nr:hypothetical protein [Geomicrobium halophilum]
MNKFLSYFTGCVILSIIGVVGTGILMTLYAAVSMMIMGR